MTRKTRGRNCNNRTARNPSNKRNHSAAASSIKALTIGDACLGLLPIKLVDSIIRRGGVHNA